MIIFDSFELDLEQQCLRGPDSPISLRPKTYAVLCHLIEKAPGIVSQDALLDAVWGHQATSVAQTIKELRNALGDSSSNPNFIATRRRMGYQFIAEITRRDTGAVQREEASTPNPARPERDGQFRADRWLTRPLALVAQSDCSSCWRPSDAERFAPWRRPDRARAEIDPSA